eukprot:sb/3471347/
MSRICVYRLRADLSLPLLRSPGDLPARWQGVTSLPILTTDQNNTISSKNKLFIFTALSHRFLLPRQYKKYGDLKFLCYQKPPSRLDRIGTHREIGLPRKSCFERLPKWRFLKLPVNNALLQKILIKKLRFMKFETELISFKIEKSFYHCPVTVSQTEQALESLEKCDISRTLCIGGARGNDAITH